jgi:hypothetical protein
MSGWSTIQKFRKLEERADKLGLKFAAYKHDDRYGENVALVPKDTDALPIYSRDAEMFVGSIADADCWMRGVLWAREYDRMTIDRKMDAKRARKEQDERNRQLAKTLKDGKMPTLVKT